VNYELLDHRAVVRYSTEHKLRRCSLIAYGLAGLLYKAPFIEATTLIATFSGEKKNDNFTNFDFSCYRGSDRVALWRDSISFS